MTGAVAIQKPKEVSLVTIAEKVRVEHEQAQAAFGAAVEHAIRAGELLTKAKAGVEHGAWLPWLSENFDFTRQTATAYMRLYANRDKLQMEGPPSISSALKQLTAPMSPVVTAAPMSAYVVDSERKRRIAEKAKDRLEALVIHPATLEAVCQERGGVAKAVALDQALAVTSDDEIDAMLRDLESGIRRYRELRDALRERRPTR